MGRTNNLNTFIEDILSKAQSEVKALSTQRATLTLNLKKLEGDRDKLSNEILGLTEQSEKTKKDTKEKAEAILKSAQDKIGSANEKESAAIVKTAELNSKIREADNLIKSNNDLKTSLVKQNDAAKNRIKKINEIAKTIEKLIENIGE